MACWSWILPTAWAFHCRAPPASLTNAGCCWAFGAASAASDRACIATNGTIQVYWLLSCPFHLHPIILPPLTIAFSPFSIQPFDHHLLSILRSLSNACNPPFPLFSFLTRANTRAPVLRCLRRCRLARRTCASTRSRRSPACRTTLAAWAAASTLPGPTSRPQGDVHAPVFLSPSATLFAMQLPCAQFTPDPLPISPPTNPLRPLAAL